MLSFDREEYLCDPVAAYQRRKSFVRQERELPFYDYRIDLFCFSAKLDLTVAIELKLQRWRRAVQQAVVYQLCADLVYIALPSFTIPRVNIAQLEEHGIGLIAVYSTNRCRLILDATHSTVVRPHYRRHYIDVVGKAA